MKSFPLLLGLLLAPALSIPAWAADNTIMIHDPYVRLAPPNAQATGAFMLLKNSGSTERKLIKAASPAAKTVELHTHINENGIMKMREVPAIDVKAHGQTELKPGSYHVMLIDMKAALKEGDIVPITLSFDDGSTQQIAAPVRKIQTTATPAEKGMAHGGMKH